MFGGWKCWTCWKRKLKTKAQPLPTLDVLTEALQRLEKMENDFTKQAAQEFEKAKEFARAKNKGAAIQCLKRKRQIEQPIEQLRNCQLQIHNQMIMLKEAQAMTETVDALRTGAAAMKAMQKPKNIADVDNIMDQINEHHETMKKMQEAVSAPSDAAAFFDEDELEEDFEKLAGAKSKEQLPPATTTSAASEHVIAGLLPAPPVPQGSD